MEEHNEKQCEASVKLLLVDDHPIVLEGLRSALQKFEDIEIVGEASTGKEAIVKAQSILPTLILIDIGLPEMSGIEAAREILKTAPGIKILILTLHDDREYITQSIQTGIQGYVLKDSSPAELIQAIRSVAKGGTFFSPRIAKKILDDLVARKRTTLDPEQKPLTKRELEVLGKIAEGLCNKEICSLLCIGLRTVESHRSRIMKKLNIHSVAGLTKYTISKK